MSYRAELRPSSREVLSHLFTRHASVISRARITGGRSVEDFEAAGVEEAAWSLDSATAAAAALLGYPVREIGGGALIDAVRIDTLGVAERDIVVAVDGQPVSTATELRSALAGRKAVRLSVLRTLAGRPAGRTAHGHAWPGSPTAPGGCGWSPPSAGWSTASTRTWTCRTTCAARRSGWPAR